MWFEVIGPRYDWMPSARTMVFYGPGQPHFGTKACVENGVKMGLVRKIAKPKGWKVGKDGVAVRDE